MFKPWQKPDAETKPDPFSLESLIAWLRTKPADEEYNYWNVDGKCLISQFVLAMGAPTRGYGRYLPDSGVGEIGEIANARPWTMGAALSRALALQSKSRSR